MKTSQNSQNWIKRIAKIASRNDRSIYSYLFRPNQYSQFFELAVENLITDVLESDEILVGEQQVDEQGVPVVSESVVDKPVEKIDWSAEEFDPFGLNR